MCTVAEAESKFPNISKAANHRASRVAALSGHASRPPRRHTASQPIRRPSVPPVAKLKLLGWLRIGRGGLRLLNFQEPETNALLPRSGIYAKEDAKFPLRLAWRMVKCSKEDIGRRIVNELYSL